MTQTVAAAQLRAFVERIERIEADIKEMNADKSEVYKELRGVGFDVKAVRQCVVARKLDSSELDERNAVFDMYWGALAGASRVHVHEGHRIPAQDGGGTATRESASDKSKAGQPASEQKLAEADLNDGTPAGQTGIEVVTGGESAATIPETFEPPAFLAKERKPLRPLCLNPSECAGYGTHTCHRCLKAAGEIAA